MTRASFDSSHAVAFDLPRGIVEGAGDRLMVVPASLLEEIAETAGAAVAVTIARAIGASCGQRIATRLGGVEAVRSGSIESVVSHLAGELAVSGVGSAHIERWGRALVVVVTNSPVRDDAAVAALVEGALSVATDRPVSCLALAREAGVVRVLVASSGAVDRAKALLGKGASWGDVLGKLQSRGQA